MDPSIFEPGSLTSTSSVTDVLDAFVEYLHKWEGHEGISADGTCYIVGDDGAGHPTVGYGVDIYNSGYKDEFIAAGYDISIGAQIPIEFVDAIEKKEISSKAAAVEAQTSGLNLTTYQKYALISRCYNCGVAGALTYDRGGYSSFVAAYKALWNEATDDMYQKAKKGDYSHKLYTSYMSMPTTSNGSYMLRIGT